jgi:GWxTD domain-containing protein
LAASFILFVAAPARAQSSAGCPAAGPANSSTLPRAYQRWLIEDVDWIITPPEEMAFLRLSSKEERDRFIAEFWERRNPNPDRPNNPFKEEHYRRIAYANVHFQEGIPGWETDRGRIYIVYGTPDRVEVEAAHGSRQAVEIWHYNSFSFTEPKVFNFVDVCGCGDYRLEERGN